MIVFGLGEISGQDKSISVVERLVKKGIRGRSVLFTGPKGTGKFTTALLTALHILKTKNQVLHPDLFVYRFDSFTLKTDAFLKISQRNTNPEFFNRLRIFTALTLTSALRNAEDQKISGKKYDDFQEKVYSATRFLTSADEIKRNFKQFSSILINLSELADAKNVFPISAVRSVIRFLSEKPSGSFRVAVLGGIEHASPEAMNALLKTLEEPPYDSVIILTSDNPSKVLPTVLSRCVKVRFSRLSDEDIFHILTNILGVNSDIASEVSFESRGSMFNAFKDIALEISTWRKRLTSHFFNTVIPNVRDGEILFSFIDEVASDTEKTSAFIEGVAEVLRLALYKRQGISENCPQEVEGVVNKMAKKYPPTVLKVIYDKLINIKREAVEGFVNPSLALTDFALQMNKWIGGK